MTFDTNPPRARWSILCPITLVIATGCSPSPEPHQRAVSVTQQELVVDNDDRVFATRAAHALLGRSPLSRQELDDFVAVMDAGQADPALRRTALIDCMMGDGAPTVCQTAGPDFTRYWSRVLMDMLLLSRKNDGQYTKPDCWGSSGLTGTPAQRAPTERAIARHVAEAAPTETLAGVGPFSMVDLLRGSVHTDLRAAYRASLITSLSGPSQATVSEANHRAENFSRFENAYLNRQQLCLYCHNTEVSVTDEISGWDRFFPVPFKVEAAVFGCSDGACAEPPDLHTDFRVRGVLGGGTAPWGISGCGTYNASPTPETGCPDLEELGDPSDPNNADVLANVCFQDQDEVYRAPRTALMAQDATQPSVYRLADLFYRGANGLLQLDFDVPLYEAIDIAADDPVQQGAMGFALLTAMNVVDQVWNEVHGGELTISLHFPRDSGQRDVLMELTRDLVQPATGDSWSLRYLLKRILLRPEFNAAPANGDEYGLAVIFNAWALHDPRPDGTPAPECDGAAPTFYGCIAPVLQTTCRGGSCHSYGTPESMQEWVYEDAAACSLEYDSADCQSTAEVDCATDFDKAGVRMAVRVNCANETLRMPRLGAALPSIVTAGVSRWVTDGTVGEEPTEVPAPEEDSNHIPIPEGYFEANGVGDAVHWKTSYQVIYSMGSTLFRPTPGALAGPDPWAAPIPTPTTYPTKNMAIATGQYLDNGLSGGRGPSYLGLLSWESEHRAPDDGTPCKVGDGNDALRALAAPGSTVGIAVATLKLRMLSEDTLFEGEQALLEDVLGRGLDEAITTGNRADVELGLRRICNVFMKSPHFLLSYVPPAEAVITAALAADPSLRVAGAQFGSPLLAAGESPPVAAASVEPLAPLLQSAAGRAIEAPLPTICAGRLDCRQARAPLLTQLDGCMSHRPSCAPGKTDQVLALLANLRLPVEAPELDLERALRDNPAAVPTSGSELWNSRLLVLPLDGGHILRSTGTVWALRDDSFGRVLAGDTLRFGDVVFIPTGVRLEVDVEGEQYATGPAGMEGLPSGETLPSPVDRGQPIRWWVLLVNGPAASTGPLPGIDPRVDLGRPLAPVEPKTVGTRPVWAQYGEAGLWYRQP